MNRIATAALAIVLAVATEAGSQPLPVFVPGHPPRDERSKKDTRVSHAPPRLHPTLCTIINVHSAEAIVLDPTTAPDEDASIATLLRDRSTWEEHPIAPGCIATLRAAAANFHARRVEVVSGYRSDKLNEHLRKKGHHVAQHSQHVLGHAVDFRLVGVATPVLLRYLRRVHNGGIGFYPQSGFVHVDVGPRRQWSGE